MTFELAPTLVKETESGNGVTRYMVLEASQNSIIPSDAAILFIGGQQSPLERLYSAAEYFATFGKTYTYEVLGLGARKRSDFETATNRQIGLEIATFMRTVVAEKKVFLIAASGGMFNVSELLQHDEEMSKRVVGIVSIVGIVSKDTIGLPPWLLSLALGVLKFLLNKQVTALIEGWFRDDGRARLAAKIFLKIKGVTVISQEQRDLFITFLTYMWQHQDWATNMFTLKQYVTSSIPSTPKINTPLLSLYSKHDEYFSFEGQKRDIESVYTNVKWIPLENIGHAPIYESDPKSYANVAPSAVVVDFFNRCIGAQPQ